jgi:hypothetical protein
MLHAELLSALAVARRRDLQEHATTRWCLGRLAHRRRPVVEIPQHPAEGAPRWNRQLNASSAGTSRRPDMPPFPQGHPVAFDCA